MEREVGEGREGEGEMRKGRRTGVEMRKGIVIGGMVIGLLMGCNNGGEISAAEKEAEGLRLGETAKSVFSSFVDLITNGLGISVTSSTTKSQISGKFKDLADLIEKAIGQVQGAASKAGINIEEAKDGSVGQAKKKLDELKKHVISLQDLTNGELVVSGVTATKSTQVKGVGSNADDVKKALLALKGIVNANVDKGITPKNETVSTDLQDGGKVLKTGGSGEALEADAAKALSIVNSVTGKDMLYAITLADETQDVATVTNINQATDPKHAVKLAVEGSATTATGGQKASRVAVAGGIALRSLFKDGKLDAGSSSGDAMAVNGVGVSAASKLVNAIESVIQVVIKQCLEQTKQILGDIKSKSVQK